MHAVFWLLVLVSASVKMALSQGLEINSTADFVSFVNTVKKTIIYYKMFSNSYRDIIHI